MPRADRVAMVCRTRKTSSHFIVRNAATVFVALDCISQSGYISMPIGALGVCCTPCSDRNNDKVAECRHRHRENNVSNKGLELHQPLVAKGPGALLQLQQTMS